MTVVFLRLYYHGGDRFFTRTIWFIIRYVVAFVCRDPDLSYLQTRVSIAFRWGCKRRSDGRLRKTSGVFCLKSNVFRQKRLILF